METSFYMFLSSVIMISLSGVLMPGPLFAITLQKAAKSKIAGALIGLGHGIVEFPVMLLIYFLLSQFTIPTSVQSVIGIIGGSFMIFMGIHTLKNRNRQDTSSVSLKRDSIIAGIWTSAASAGFIIWWLTIGTVLIANAQLFGFPGFCVFAGVHWSVDFIWYTLLGFLVFKSQKFWNKKVHYTITLFCAGVFLLFGIYFISSAIMA
ncbi:MAG: LysE family translocator, partial [Nitrososphaerota archaeon]|nr:LysE family translocator [Nitrososphaerota archaeon]